jgi:hypothetical protein
MIAAVSAKFLRALEQPAFTARALLVGRGLIASSINLFASEF